MAKQKQNQAKGTNMDTDVDTSSMGENSTDELYRKQYKTYIDDISKPIDELGIQGDEDKAEILPPYRSELFQIDLTGNESDELVESVLDQIDEYATRLIFNPDQFILLIKQKPSLIFNDIVIKFTIRKLQSLILQNNSMNPEFEKTGQTVVKAMKILEDAGLSIFKPKQAPKRANIVKNALYSWKANPREFISMLTITRENMVERINCIMRERNMRFRQSKNKSAVYRMAYKQMYGQKPSVPEIVIKKYLDRPTAMSVIFLSEQCGVSFESAISFWKSSTIPSEIKKKVHRGKPKIF